MSNQALKEVSKSLVRSDHKTLRSLLSEFLLTRTQQEGAKLLGISQPSLSSWLHVPMRSRPSLRSARIMAKVLKVEVSYIMNISYGLNESK